MYASRKTSSHLIPLIQGQIQDFHLGGGGGGAKDYVPAQAREPNSLLAEAGPGSSRVVLMLSRAI